MEELIEWLKANKIKHAIVEEDVVEIIGFGKMLYEDTTKMKSIFRVNKDNELLFNGIASPDELVKDGIFYTTFKFGNNWYFFDVRKGFELNILKYIGEKEECSNQTEIANLGAHTPYELLNGSFMIKEWVKKAKYCGHKYLGICDKNTMAACYSLQKECDLAGISPVFGYSLDFKDEFGDIVGAKVYVQTQQGLKNLLRIQKAIMVDSADSTISFKELLQRGGGNVIVLDKFSSNWIKDNKFLTDKLKQSFQDVYYQVDLSEYKADRIDIRVLEATKVYFDDIFEKGVEPILLTDAYYLDKADHKNKIILNKIATKAAHNQSDDQYYKDVDEHYAAFSQIFDKDKWEKKGYSIQSLFELCANNALKVAEGAKARFENTRNFMPKYSMTKEEEEKYGSAHNMFNQLIEEGLKRLVPKEDHKRYRKQIDYEKYIIESTNNIDYLLVQYDTCNWARQNGILVGCGRGSAAGSLLLYLLGITLVDPLKYDLIFERFLLPERAGLYEADVTVIGKDIESKEYVELELDNGKTIKVDIDAELMIKRNGCDPQKVYADELEEDDEILIDNKDLLFTINEL